MAGYIKPECVRYRGESRASRETQPKSAASNWEDHAFVFINASGELQECGAPGSITAVYAIDTLRANATDIVERNVEGITSDAEILMSTSYTGNQPLAVTSQSLVGKKFGIIKVVSGGKDYWTVDINPASMPDAVVEIVKIAPEYPMGELNGPVYAKVAKQWLQFQP